MSRYGAINPPSANTSPHHSNTSDEHDALLTAHHHHHHHHHPPHPTTRLSRYLNAPLSDEHADLVLLFCYTITGVLDTSATHTWGSFVSMQTGNTIYLGSGILSPHNGSTRWVRALLAIASFCVGSFCFARFHARFGARRRWVLLVSYAVQWAMVLAAAVLVTVGPPASTDGPVEPWVAVPLVLLGWQSAGQAVLSRVLHQGSLTSVVLTSIYCDLFADLDLFAGLRANAERNRRAAAPLMLIGGAVIGGLWDQKTTVGLTGALWTAVGMKAVLVVIWLFWKEELDETK